MIIKLNIDNVDYTVTAIVPPPPPQPPISSTGLLLVPASLNPQVIKLDTLAWSGVHDSATSGSATGLSVYPVTVGGRRARSFVSNYMNNGGLRYHCAYGNDAAAHNFVYAGDLWFDDLTPLAQMELDNNQVVDDKTYIFGVQANNTSGAWDVTKADTTCHWVPTTAKGSPNAWPAKTWLHFEIASHRDDAGNITYDAVHFNGMTQQIGITFPASLALRWKPLGLLMVNLQLGGALASGSILVYGSNLCVARW